MAEEEDLWGSETVSTPCVTLLDRFFLKVTSRYNHAYKQWFGTSKEKGIPCESKMLLVEILDQHMQDEGLLWCPVCNSTSHPAQITPQSCVQAKFVAYKNPLSGKWSSDAWWRGSMRPQNIACTNTWSSHAWLRVPLRPWNVACSHTVPEHHMPN